MEVKRINRRKILRLAVAAILIIIVVFGVRSIVGSPESQGTDKATKIEAPKPQSVAEINRNFEFSLKDNKGVKIATFTYTVEKAELQKEIVVKGKKATAVSGRIFLLVTLKLTNTLNQGLEVKSRNYIRLAVNGGSEWLAPEIHNDPVEVQAISTKYTRVGFTINETDYDYVFQVGEVEGQKETIKPEFKK